jgi:SAM-dependent methyltransferase
MQIECPDKGGQAEICAWRQRKGCVRDFPSVGVIECQDCGLVTHDQDLREEVNYESGSMHSWASGYGDSLPGPESDKLRRVTAINKLAESKNIDSILDFGCGSGGMLSALENNFRVFGLEPDSAARDAAINLGYEVFESAKIALASKVQVDMVTLFHVVEHFYEASVELNQIFELLRPGGIVIIETPNSMDVLLSKYESEAFSNFTYWSHHPMLHSSRSLERLVERSRYKIIESSGVQRYDLNNHLFWLSNARPGGHSVWKDFLSKESLDAYEKFLIQAGISDTLWVVACKP